jgi:metal-dependent amidase/aminoacylase/carboxypeptidase family protein
MITASMRKELSERLKYTAEDIKAMTPLEASLILHHSVKPTEKDDLFPGFLRAHQEEQERRQQEQARIQEEEILLAEREKQKEEALVAAKEMAHSESSPAISQNNAPTEGLVATQQVTSKRQLSDEASAKQPDSPPLGYSLEIPTRYSADSSTSKKKMNNLLDTLLRPWKQRWTESGNGTRLLRPETMIIRRLP